MNTKSSFNTLLLILIAGISIYLFPSCEKLKDAATFKVKYDLPDSHFTVDPLNLLKTEKALFSQTYSINMDSILGANKGLVSNVSFYKIRLSVVSPDEVTLGWINSARITITPAGGTPIEIATAPTISSTMRSVDFDIKNSDISPALNGPFQLDVYGTVKPPFPASAFELLFESGIEITISPLK